MASRVQNPIQNRLWFLSFSTPSSSSLCNSVSLKKTRFRNRSPFGKRMSWSSSRRSLYCTCSSSRGSTMDPNTSPITGRQNAEPFVITTPLYYVNAPPHMGSAYTTIAADAIARFQRLLGNKVIFITGTDEHGEKIATAAAACGCSPAEHCDVVSQTYRTLWRDLGIAYDKFIRTTDSKHEAVVKEFYSKVLANGDIYQADYEGLYCVNCEEYKETFQNLFFLWSPP